MNNIYIFYYPNGDIKKHKNERRDKPPRVDGVFWTSGKFYQIVEMSEADCWIEEISKDNYFAQSLNGSKFVDLIMYSWHKDQFMASLKEF